MSFWLGVQRYKIRTKQAEGLSSNEIEPNPKNKVLPKRKKNDNL
jgi:hypothetical protein